MFLSLAATLALGCTSSTTEGSIPWITSVDVAKATAAKEGKDLLINFTGSDWCGWCTRLDEEVFSHEEFVKAASEKFVFLYLDFPRGEEPKSKVVDAALNDQLQADYTVGGFPSIILTDAEGRPYGRTGYQAGGPAAYLEHLAELRETGQPIRDLVSAKKATPEMVAKAFPLMADTDMLAYPGFAPFLKMAKKIDADGSKGWTKKILGAEQNAEFKKLLDKNFGPDLIPDWEKLAAFIAKNEHISGNAFVQIGMGCTQEYLVPNSKFAEAKAIFVRVKAEPMLAENDEAQKQLQAMIDDMDQKAKDAAGDDG